MKFADMKRFWEAKLGGGVADTAASNCCHSGAIGTSQIGPPRPNKRYRSHTVAHVPGSVIVSEPVKSRYVTKGMQSNAKTIALDDHSLACYNDIKQRDIADDVTPVSHFTYANRNEKDRAAVSAAQYRNSNEKNSSVHGIFHRIRNSVHGKNKHSENHYSREKTIRASVVKTQLQGTILRPVKDVYVIEKESEKKYSTGRVSQNTDSSNNYQVSSLALSPGFWSIKRKKKPSNERSRSEPKDVTRFASSKNNTLDRGQRRDATPSSDFNIKLSEFKTVDLSDGLFTRISQFPASAMDNSGAERKTKEPMTLSKYITNAHSPTMSSNHNRTDKSNYRRETQTTAAMKAGDLSDKENASLLYVTPASAPSSIHTSPVHHLNTNPQKTKRTDPMETSSKFNQIHNFWQMKEQKSVVQSVQERRCVICGCFLAQRYSEKNGLLYCEEDYLDKYGQRCNKCMSIITGPIMIAGSLHFHPECFVCVHCHNFISDGDRYAVVLPGNDLTILFCSKCFENVNEHSSSFSNQNNDSETVCCLAIVVVDYFPDKQLQVKDHVLIPSAKATASHPMASPVGQTVNFIGQNLSTHSLKLGDRILQVNGLRVNHNALDLIERLTDGSDKPLQLTVEREIYLNKSYFPSVEDDQNISLDRETPEYDIGSNVIVKQPQTLNASISPKETTGKEIMDEEFCRLHSSGSQDAIVAHNISCTLLPSVMSSKDLCCSATQNNIISPTAHGMPLSNISRSDDGLNQYSSKTSVNETSMLHSSDCAKNYDITVHSSIFNGQRNSTVSDENLTGHAANRRYHETLSDSEYIDDENKNTLLHDFANTDVHGLADTSSTTDSDTESDGRKHFQNKIPDIAVNPTSVLSSPSSSDENSNVTKPSNIEQTTGIMEIIFKKPPSPITRRGGVKRISVPKKEIDSNATSLSGEDQPPMDVVLRKRNNKPLKGTLTKTLIVHPKRSNSLKTAPDGSTVIMRKSSPKMNNVHRCTSDTNVSANSSLTSHSSFREHHSPFNKDLNRSESMRIHSGMVNQVHKVFRPCDLIHGEVLGSGFFGSAIKVTHRDTGEVMVLKILNSLDDSVEKTFIKEVKVMRNLNHPNVLRFIGVLYKDKRLNLITEFVECGTLRELIFDTDDPFPWLRRIEVARDISSGMAYLHAMQIIHRDLNSANCFVKKNGTVVVADFGLARVMQRQTSSMARRKRYTVVGSAYWMAPEMLYRAKYDECVDVFSFGIVLCEIIGRVNADPSFLPRRRDFGLAVQEYFDQFCDDCPAFYFAIAVLACDITPEKRPTFATLEAWYHMILIHYDVPQMRFPPEIEELTNEVYTRCGLPMPSSCLNSKNGTACHSRDPPKEKQSPEKTMQFNQSDNTQSQEDGASTSNDSESSISNTVDTTCFMLNDNCQHKSSLDEKAAEDSSQLNTRVKEMECKGTGFFAESSPNHIGSESYAIQHLGEKGRKKLALPRTQNSPSPTLPLEIRDVYSTMHGI